MDAPGLHLEALPNELISRIADSVDEDEENEDYNTSRDPATSILNLRLTSKRLSAFATRTLAHRLSSLLVFMTRDSLQTLAKICAHPIFGRHIRMIRFVTHRVHPEYIRDVSNQVLEALEAEEEEEADDDASEVVEALRNKLYLCMDRCTREAQLARSGEATDLLVKAFASLNQHEASVYLALGASWMVNGIHHWLGKDVYDSDDSWDTHEDIHLKTAVEPCLMAVARSGLHIDGLDIDVQGLSTDRNERSFDLETMSVEGEGLSAYSAMKVVSLTFGPSHQKSSIRSMAQILYPAKNLEVFEYHQCSNSMHHYLTSDLFDNGDLIIQSVTSNSLRRLELTYLCISANVLIELLDRNRDTLRDIQFECATLRGKTNDDGLGACIEVMTWIKDNLSLERLYFDELSDIEHIAQEEYYVNVPVCAGFSFTESETVNEGLERFIKQKGP